MMKRLQQVAPSVTTCEALVKLTIVVCVAVPIPITAFTATGFWLDYYKLDTVPLFTILGAVLGTILAFAGVVQTIVFGHKESNTKGGGT